ncbi:MAG: hypothetical protein VX704_07615, partial [Verrucomicrobiota bacterium]|nr:hypothetical protein [Verrucomicrobiota bacterium]
ERYWNTPTRSGLVGAGHGWTMHEMLLHYTKVPMHVFHCPADQRLYELEKKNSTISGQQLLGRKSPYQNRHH